MFLLAVGMIGLFWHRGWIGVSRPPDLDDLQRRD
jgi:hypothetical protein